MALVLELFLGVSFLVLAIKWLSKGGKAFLELVPADLLFYRQHKPKKKALPPPPGPYQIPLLGSIQAFLSLNFRHSFSQLKREYGPIFSYKLLFYNAVGISDYQLIKEALNHPDLWHRPRLHAFEDFRYPSAVDGSVKGIIFGNGDEWRNLRRFVLRTLRDLGMGRDETVPFVQEEMQKLADRLKEALQGQSGSGGTLDLSGMLNVAVVNTLWRIVTGECLDQRDPKITAVTAAFTRLVQTNPASLWTLFPSSRHYLPTLSGYSGARAAHEEVLRIAKENIEAYLAGQGHENSLIASFVEDIRAQEAKGLSTEGWKKTLAVTIMDLFGAGSETTSTTLLFAIKLLSQHPTVQENIYNEVMASESDNIQELPYTQAVIHEVLRHSCIAYMGIPHCARRTTELAGYTIEKGTMISLHLWDVLRDPETFPEPEVFKPERFLDQEGKFKSDTQCIPFLLGQRMCPGKSLALQELLVFLTGLIRQFQFKMAPQETGSEASVIEGLILTCSRFKVQCKER